MKQTAPKIQSLKRILITKLIMNNSYKKSAKIIHLQICWITLYILKIIKNKRIKHFWRKKSILKITNFST